MSPFTAVTTSTPLFIRSSIKQAVRNPGSSYTESLSIVVSLAVLQMKMTAAEAISAITINAACAVERADIIGQLTPGFQADVVIWDMQNYRELPYHYGVNLVTNVIKKGKVVV